MREVKVVNLIFEAEKRVVDRFEALCLVCVLAVVVVEVDGEEGPELRWRQLLPTHELHDTNPLEGRCAHPQVEPVLSSVHFRFIRYDGEFTHRILLASVRFSFQEAEVGVKLVEILF